jgi:hypothetical protein
MRGLPALAVAGLLILMAFGATPVHAVTPWTVVGDTGTNLILFGFTIDGSGNMWGCSEFGGLYSIDSSTGVGTLVGTMTYSVGGVGGTDVGFCLGLAYYSGSVYALVTDGGDTYTNLTTLDTSTGATTNIGIVVSYSQFFQGLTANPTTGTLYTSFFDGSGFIGIDSIDHTTAALSSLGDFSDPVYAPDFWGLSFNPTNGDLLFIGDNASYTQPAVAIEGVNPTTLASTGFASKSGSDFGCGGSNFPVIWSTAISQSGSLYMLGECNGSPSDSILYAYSGSLTPVPPPPTKASFAISLTLQGPQLLNPADDPEAFTLTGCHISLSAVPGDGTNHSLTADPNCQVTIAPESYPGLTFTIVPTDTFMTCPAGTCPTNQTFQYRESEASGAGGGGPPATNPNTVQTTVFPTVSTTASQSQSSGGNTIDLSWITVPMILTVAGAVSLVAVVIYAVKHH